MRNVSDDEKIVEQFAQEFPPLLNVQQASQLAQVSTKTIYDWSSRGELDHIKRRCGRRLRIKRDGFVRYLLNCSN